MKLLTANVCLTTSSCHLREVIRRMNEARSSHTCMPINNPLSLDLATRCYIRNNQRNASPKTCLYKRIDEQDRIKLSRAITSSTRISMTHRQYIARHTINMLLSLRGDWDLIALVAQRAAYSSSILVFAPVLARAARLLAIRSRPLLKKEYTFRHPVCSRRATIRTSIRRYWHQQRSKRHRLASISTHWNAS